MALVLAAFGLFVYLRLEAELDASLGQGLRSRAGVVAALIRQSDNGLSETAGGGPLGDPDESFAQVLDAQGRVIDSTRRFRRGRALLTEAEVARATRETFTLDRNVPVEPGDAEPARLLATPVQAQGRRTVVVVGASLEDQRGALRTLGVLLAIGGPIALLLASAAGYGVAAAALRPVERMRRRAAAITESEPGARLPVPAARDELSRLGDTLNAMLARLEGALERERTFVADASHELRTPLAILKTELELALRAGRSRAELHAAVSSAAEETDRLAQLAEDLLVIAHADQGRLPVRLETIDAGRLLSGASERFARRSAEAGRSVDADAPAGLALAGDPVRLEQALGNLVENALRHGDGPIRLVAARRGDHVELHVTDDGPGFAPEFLDSAFERFSRADSGRSRGGTGLGLAIVDVIARAHGGRARAANRPGRGADVWIELPTRPAPSSAAHAGVVEPVSMSTITGGTP